MADDRDALLARALVLLEAIQWLEEDTWNGVKCFVCGERIHEGDRDKPGMHGEECELGALLSDLRAMYQRFDIAGAVEITGYDRSHLYRLKRTGKLTDHGGARPFSGPELLALPPRSPAGRPRSQDSR